MVCIRPTHVCKLYLHMPITYRLSLIVIPLHVTTLGKLFTPLSTRALLLPICGYEAVPLTYDRIQLYGQTSTENISVWKLTDHGQALITARCDCLFAP